MRQVVTRLRTPWGGWTGTLALVGLMGVGKTSVGRRVAQALDLPFRDADEEIEVAAGRSVADIFAERGEAEFRSGERRVIARLLSEPPTCWRPAGGAFMNADTRALLLERAVVVWLKADLDVLVRRVGRRDSRPLLRGKEPARGAGALDGRAPPDLRGGASRGGDGRHARTTPP
jgi:shikimate kinase